MRIKSFTGLWLALCLTAGLTGAARAQNPGGIGTAPILSLRAGDITATDGAALPSWPAHVGPSPAQSASAAQPTYHASGQNAKPYVTFATHQGLYTTSLSNAASSYDLFFTARMADATSVNPHWALDSQSGRLVFYGNQGGNGGFYEGAFNGFGTVTSPTTTHVFEYRMIAGGQGTLLEDNVSLGSASYTAIALGGVTAVGDAEDDAGVGGTGPTGSGFGDVYDVELFNTNLSDSDRNAVGSSLASTYGLTTSYTASKRGDRPPTARASSTARTTGSSRRGARRRSTPVPTSAHTFPAPRRVRSASPSARRRPTANCGRGCRVAPGRSISRPPPGRRPGRWRCRQGPRRRSTCWSSWSRAPRRLRTGGTRRRPPSSSPG